MLDDLLDDLIYHLWIRPTLWLGDWMRGQTPRQLRRNSQEIKALMEMLWGDRHAH